MTTAPKQFILSLEGVNKTFDGFKAINDTYGHAYGDEILKMVSQRLLANSRKEDTVARLGGDEFIVLLGDIHSLPDAQGPAAKLVEAARLVDEVAETMWAARRGGELTSTPWSLRWSGSWTPARPARLR